MRDDFKKWLTDQKYSPHVVSSRTSNVRKVERSYGDLEEQINRGTLPRILSEFEYSMEDARRNRPNPSKVSIDGDLRTGLATLKSAVGLYRDFLQAGWKGSNQEHLADDPVTVPDEAQSPAVSTTVATSQKLSLERDMQIALRRDIKKLGQTLTIVDDGGERYVRSGRIDITCEDSSDGALVVVELKAGTAGRQAIGQILSYIGDLMAEEDGRTVRGILVAHEFDPNCVSGVRATPQLTLMSYSIEFHFASKV